MIKTRSGRDPAAVSAEAELARRGPRADKELTDATGGQGRGRQSEQISNAPHFKFKENLIRYEPQARAMAELKAVLAATQYRVWKEAPPEMQHPCDLANQVWETGTTLGLGLPLEEREFGGRTRTFESESREPLRPELFRVPERLTAIDAPS